VDDLFLGRLVHGKQPAQVREQLPALLAVCGGDLGEQALDLLVLALQKGHDVLSAVDLDVSGHAETPPSTNFDGFPDDTRALLGDTAGCSSPTRAAAPSHAARTSSCGRHAVTAAVARHSWVG
jgi:hypothetical protein